MAEAKPTHFTHNPYTFDVIPKSFRTSEHLPPQGAVIACGYRLDPYNRTGRVPMSCVEGLGWVEDADFPRQVASGPVEPVRRVSEAQPIPTPAEALPAPPIPASEPHLECYEVGKEIRREVPRVDPSMLPTQMMVGQLPTCKNIAFNVLWMMSAVTGIPVGNASPKGKGMLQCYVASDQDRERFLEWNECALVRDGLLFVARDREGMDLLQALQDEIAQNPTSGNPSRCIHFELPRPRQSIEPTLPIPTAPSGATF